MNTEDLFLSRGPRSFRFLVEAVRTQAEAAEIMQVGGMTVSRWREAEPQQTPFGRRVPRSWRSSWWGYPAPLPAFDRICERVLGRDFLSSLCAARTCDETTALRRFREEGVHLSSVVDMSAAAEACRALQIPNSTRSRLFTLAEWPSQWTAADRLTFHVLHRGWPEFVLSGSVDEGTEQAPKAALRAMLVAVKVI